MVPSMKKHQSTITCLLHLSIINKQLLLSGGQDNLVFLWNIELKVAIKEFNEHCEAISDLGYIRDSIFASSSADCTIKIWDALANKSNDNTCTQETSIFTIKPTDFSINTILNLDILNNDIIVILDSGKNLIFYDLNKEMIIKTQELDFEGIILRKYYKSNFCCFICCDLYNVNFFDNIKEIQLNFINLETSI